MKLNKYYLSILVIIISLSSFGQEVSKEKESKKVVEMTQDADQTMKENLNLSVDQIPKVSEINLAFSKKMVTLFKAPGSMFGKIGDVKKNMKDRNLQFKKVLTEEQMKVFKDKIESKLRKNMKKIMKSDS